MKKNMKKIFSILFLTLTLTVPSFGQFPVYQAYLQSDLNGNQKNMTNINNIQVDEINGAPPGTAMYLATNNLILVDSVGRVVYPLIFFTNNWTNILKFLQAGDNMTFVYSGGRLVLSATTLNTNIAVVGSGNIDRAKVSVNTKAGGTGIVEIVNDGVVGAYLEAVGQDGFDRTRLASIWPLIFEATNGANFYFDKLNIHNSKITIENNSLGGGPNNTFTIIPPDGDDAPLLIFATNNGIRGLGIQYQHTGDSTDGFVIRTFQTNHFGDSIWLIATADINLEAQGAINFKSSDLLTLHSIDRVRFESDVDIIDAMSNHLFNVEGFWYRQSDSLPVIQRGFDLANKEVSGDFYWHDRQDFGNGIEGDIYAKSVTVSSGRMELVGDSDAPGTNKVYATSSSGNKGWQDLGSHKIIACGDYTWTNDSNFIEIPTIAGVLPGDKVQRSLYDAVNGNVWVKATAQTNAIRFEMDSTGVSNATVITYTVFRAR